MAKIEDLIKGYNRFYDKYFISDDSLYKDLAVGQSPKTLVVACSDSRVDPSIIMDAKPGDIFVIRNVANLVPPCADEDSGLHGVCAALEFAVKVLEVENIVVLGHSGCAGIKTLVNRDIDDATKDFNFVNKWVKIAEPALANIEHASDKQHACEREAVLISLNNLLTFPWIKKKVDDKALKLHGWHFSIKDGSVSVYDSEQKSFTSLAA